MWNSTNNSIQNFLSIILLEDFDQKLVRNWMIYTAIVVVEIQQPNILWLNVCNYASIKVVVRKVVNSPKQVSKLATENRKFSYCHIFLKKPSRQLCCVWFIKFSILSNCDKIHLTIDVPTYLCSFYSCSKLIVCIIDVNMKTNSLQNTDIN